MVFLFRTKEIEVLGDLPNNHLWLRDWEEKLYKQTLKQTDSGDQLGRAARLESGDCSDTSEFPAGLESQIWPERAQSEV